MLSPSMMTIETDKLAALLEVLTNPEKYKKQIEEFRQLAKDTEDKNEVLLEKQVELQNLRNDVLEVSAQAADGIRELEKVMERASKVVDEASNYRAEASARAVDVTREAKRLVQELTEAAKSTVESFKEEADKQEVRLAQLDREVMSKEAKLQEVEERLRALRESMGGV